MRKTKTIDVKLPIPLLSELQAVAKDAGLKPDTVLKVALATEARRWKRESDVRWERDMLLTFAKEVAMDVYKPAELRKRAKAVVSDAAHVPPNDQVERP